MFGSSSTPMFGSASTPAFGATSTPSAFGGSSLFGASPATPSPFGASSTPSFFGGASSTPSLFGGGSSSSTPSLFGAPTAATTAPSTLFGGGSSTPSIFGSSPTPSLFGGTPTSTSTPFGASTSAFGAATSTPPLFGGSSTPAFGGATSTPSLFGAPPQTPSLFGSASTPFGAPSSATNLFGNASTPSLFTQPTSGFGQQQPSMFGSTPPPLLQGGQLSTQMAPVAPMSIPLPDRELQVIIDAYKDDIGNPRYAFRHLLLSVTDPSMHVKPVGISDIMWAEAINKLEGMDSAERERLWPELVQGFKDLSRRLKLQDDALAADAQRLQATEANVKLLQRHFEIDTIPWIQRLRQKEQELQRRLLKMMRVVEALEGKGFRMPLTKGEAQLAVRLQNLAQQLVGPRTELPRRVESLLSSSRMQASTGGFSYMFLPGNNKIDDQSLAEMHKVLLQQTEAIGGLVSVLKKDIRDMEIICAQDVT